MSKYVDDTGALYIITKLKGLISKKVDKVDGKALSSNDFTNTLLAKLNGIAEGANKTVVDTSLSKSSSNAISNSAVATEIEKKANTNSPALTGTPTVPTAAAGTNTTQIASTAFVKSAINSAISSVKSVEFKIVSSLPTTGESNIFYLVANGGAGTNAYDEYVWIASSKTFEKLGTTDVDLSGYLKSSDVTAISNSEIETMFNS